MPADWSLPINTTAYASVLSDLASKDIDSGTMCDGGDPSNMSVGMKKYNTGTNRFQRWNGTTWVDLVLDIGGGGTGASSGPQTMHASDILFTNGLTPATPPQTAVGTGITASTSNPSGGAAPGTTTTNNPPFVVVNYIIRY